VRNITDIDDKIMARAQETGRPIDAITAETAQWYQDDMAAIGCLPPTHQPRATGHVSGMIAMIEQLIARGHAYAADGHVLFAVDSFADYGRLSGRSVDDMIAGARVEVAPYKKNPMDFVLWKPSAPDQPGWDSPWGRGRPGWHIECSAMSRALLGPDFDIHAGGSDLLFPHHENEIAQSRCAEPDHGFARYWVHNGMVQVDGRKMSKSLGNFFTVQDKLAAGVPGEVIRLALLNSGYRQPLDWTDKLVADSLKALEKWSQPLMDMPNATLNREPDPNGVDLQVIDALADDLNSPLAIARIHEISRLAQRQDNDGFQARICLLDTVWFFLGFNLHGFQPELQQVIVDVVTEQRIRNLLAARTEARKAKDFARADAIRKGLDAAGVVVMDRTGGPTEWELGPNFDPARLADIDA
jgi:cysteinyl-tRNA synthetase